MTGDEQTGAVVLTVGRNGESRTVWGVPDDPRIVTCPTCRGGFSVSCWMCAGTGLVYCNWIPHTRKAAQS